MRKRRFPKGLSTRLQNPFWLALVGSLGLHVVLWLTVAQNPLSATSTPEKLAPESMVNLVDLPTTDTPLVDQGAISALPQQVSPSVPPAPPDPTPLPDLLLPPLPPLPSLTTVVPAPPAAPAPVPTPVPTPTASATPTPPSVAQSTPQPTPTGAATPTARPTPGIFNDPIYSRRPQAQPTPQSTPQPSSASSGTSNSEGASTLTQWYQRLAASLPPGASLSPKYVRIQAGPAAQQELEGKGITGWVTPTYPEQACSAGVRPQVSIAVAVNDSGKRFGAPALVQGSGSEPLDNAVLSALLKLEYTNAGSDGYRAFIYLVTMEPPANCRTAADSERP
ncbi:energy transducer TonB [Leptolyngbya sp. FACHB-261]|uniref:energy transducer TonB n=1 Tax=Leptolyngbya sp. FACHB-261 TaxID=2692806 RepID=UPI001682D3AA|nr:hypothetical protein [Leptolyngbya sp. FACHB-261]MBD2103225.1 hypothetical protein [Leptolyngbya sp. FACHB-261]